MTAMEQREAARKFVNTWRNKGYEKGETQSFWISLMTDVLGIDHATDKIIFEKEVIVDGQTKFIDGYIAETRVLIEQKSLGKDLNKKIPQSGGIMLTPYEQAKRYANNLPVDEMPRWIVTCNFSEFHIHDMNKPGTDPVVIELENLQSQYYLFDFISNHQNEKLTKEMEISIQAGDIVGVLYDEFLKQYKDPTNDYSLKSLNALCVRLVFCLYAEDAGIFGRRGMFHDYLMRFDVRDLRRALIDLFRVLDTKPESRDPYMDEALAEFPYVNGGLFSDENIEVPQLTEKIRELILTKASEDFDWSEISPTIFGAVFESTLNPETRRSGGMHYTSLENIHKVIDPLFLEALKAELDSIKAITVAKTKKAKLEAFQTKLASLNWLDPACGSGNFLTESYISIRRLENDVIKSKIELEKGQIAGQIMFGDLAESNPIKVSIGQFYGIEINDFAVTVAKTALWIAESQMMKETEDVVHMNLDFLPLKSYANIIKGNALQLDWNEVIAKGQLNYIMGNPPFVGQAMRTKEQANDMQDVFAPSKAGGKLDYVAGWFKKSADFMRDSRIEAAFVSSNSICQGESVNLLWEMLLLDGIYINFAYTTFKWTSEAKDKAAVMCVIVGFSRIEREKKALYIDGQYRGVKHINGYLNDAPNVFIKNRSKSINKGTAKVVQGSPPADDGRLLLSVEEKENFIRKYPELEKVIKPFIGSREFINDTYYRRYCFWFVDDTPSNYRHIPELMERFNYVREYRLKSSVDRIQKTADKPYLFTQNRQPKTDYLIIPRVSSSNRRYIPIGFLPADVIASDSAVLVYDATLYDFGILCSNVHNAWMRTIAGRLKNDYRYAPSVYYNFPFPELTQTQKEKISQTAQAIIAARKLYPNNSLADMYGEEMYLYPELKKAHQANDRAVMQAYGFSVKDMSEADCVAALMELYQKKVEG